MLHHATGAVSGSRTRSLLLPKQAHYHLCYDDLSNLLGAAGSEKADPFWQWRRWGTYPSPATGYRYLLLFEKGGDQPQQVIGPFGPHIALHCLYRVEGVRSITAPATLAVVCLRLFVSIHIHFYSHPVRMTFSKPSCPLVYPRKHIACTSCDFAFLLARSDSSFSRRMKQQQRTESQEPLRDTTE